jgi:hypothetical protein
LASTAAPARVSRTILSSSAGNRAVTVSRDSSIVYDGSQRRFVNSNAPPKVNTEEAVRSSDTAGDKGKTATAQGQMRSPSVPAPAHGAAPAPRANIAPPRPPAGSVGTSHYGGPSGGTATWNAGHGGSSSSSSSSTHSSAPSGASTSHSSGGGSSHH